MEDSSKQTKTSGKRSRRFFDTDFKRDIVYKLRTKQVSLRDVEHQQKIPTPLLKRWMQAYPNIGQLPGVPLQSPDLEKQINQLLETIVARKLEQVLHTMAQNHAIDFTQAHRTL